MVSVKLGPSEVGDGHPCYVIAEAGANHDRDLDVARRLIDVAAEAGADAVKFQTYSGRTLYSTKTPRFDYLGELGAKPGARAARRHRAAARVAAGARRALPRRGHRVPLQPLRPATPWTSSMRSTSPRYKIASFELVDIPLVEYTASKGRPLILSTGMAALGEIEDAVAAARRAGAPRSACSQCASLYPAPRAHHEPPRDPDAGGRVRRAGRALRPHARHARGDRRGRARCAPAREALHARSHPYRARPPVRDRARRAARSRRAGTRRRSRARRRREARPVRRGAGRDVRQGAPFGRRRVPRSRPARGSPREMLTIKRPGHGIAPKLDRRARSAASPPSTSKTTTSSRGRCCSAMRVVCCFDEGPGAGLGHRRRMEALAAALTPARPRVRALCRCPPPSCPPPTRSSSTRTGDALTTVRSRPRP